MFKKIGGKMVVFILLICITGTSIGIPMDVYGETIQLDITQALVTGEYAFDLSKAGNIDWLHLKGNGVDSLTQIKKKGSSSITFSTKTDTSKEGKSDKGGDSNYISYTWNDGMSGYENGTDDTGFGVFFPKNTRDKGTCENVGWDFTVTSQSQEVTVAFAIGMWQAKVDLKFYADDTLVSTKQIEAGDTQVYRYQVTVPANTTLKVEGLQTEVVLDYGNFSLSGVAVSDQNSENNENVNIDDIDNQIAKLDNAVVKGYTEGSVNSLKDAIDAVKALENPSVNDKINAYSNILNAISNLEEVGQYTYETKSGMIAAFGFEGDKNAPLAFLDGSYQIGGERRMQHGPVAPKQMVTFGVTDTDNIKWYNKEGYLPCFVSEYTKDDVEYTIENFANKATVDNKDYVIAYSRVTTTNNSSEARLLPVVSDNLIPLNDQTKDTLVIGAGETVVRDYAIEADKYEYFDDGVTVFTSLTSEQVINQGTFDENYSEMKTYWDTELGEMVNIDLPNKELVNAFKAGYIYTMIIKDDTYLHVGENGYARLFSHDIIGILVQLIQSGDFEQAKDYLESIPLTGGINIETGEVDGVAFVYWDADWKLPWAYAVYLSKTGDISIFNEEMTADDGSTGTIFEKRVKLGARRIEDSRMDNGDGIMKTTRAIDSWGQWTIDNYSALTGLISYEYICRELYKETNDEYYSQEAAWAKAEYDDLLDVFSLRLQQTIDENGLDYIPISVVESNDDNRAVNPRDANWASMFLFGRWTWDGYLYGAKQPEDNSNISMIDQTYAYGINKRISADATDSIYNFGGYPHGWYSSAYNAGYGSAALRGEQYRDMGIKAYEFMLENSMSGLFSWWEGIHYPEESPWEKTNDNLSVQNTPGGGGSAQHMWGQSVSSKVLIDSLIAEKIYNQNNNIDIIVGRGIPKEWVVDAAENENVIVDVQNYPALRGGRVGYKIVRDGNDLIITFDRNNDKSTIDSSTVVNFSVELPSMVNNITKTTVGTIDNEKGIVKVPADTDVVRITLNKIVKPTDKFQLQQAYNDVEELKQGVYTDESWSVFDIARANVKSVLDNINTGQDEVDAALTTLNNAKDSLVKISSPITVVKSQLNGEYSINLSEIGNIDWMHLKGNDENLTQIKKVGSSAITFGYSGVGINGKTNNNDTNRIAYSWNDGMQGYETGTNDTGFGVFFPEGNRDAGLVENVKWNFTVNPQSQETTVVFAMGMWQAKVDVNFYVDDQLVNISQIEAGGTAQVFKYEVTVPANATLKVEAEQTMAILEYGNFSFSGVAVRSNEGVVEEKEFTIASNGVLDRTSSVKATVNVSTNQGAAEHVGREVVVFELMKGNTPMNIISLTHDINSETELTVEFNVSDPNNSEYTVKVLVLDQLDNTNNGSISLASPTILK